MKHSKPYNKHKAALDSKVVGESFIRGMCKAMHTLDRKKHQVSTSITSSGMTKKECDELVDRVWNECPQIETEQAAKGLAWLLNQWKTPKGVTRKNNPFGYVEQQVLEHFSHFELAGFYDAGRNGWAFYIPLYNVIAKDGMQFQYYAASWQSGGGVVNIVG